MNSFWLIEDYIFANDFLRFFDRSFKKRKKSCFLNLKNVKYVFSKTGYDSFSVLLHHNLTVDSAVLCQICTSIVGAAGRLWNGLSLTTFRDTFPRTYDVI